MSHTFTNLLTHIVFSTKARAPYVTDEIKSELYAYLGGLIKELKGKPLAIGGMPDHVHLLVESSPIIPISEVMRFVKTNSSKWVTEKFDKPFDWQKGYGAFSVSRSNVDAVVKYIDNQAEHHRKFDFKAEFVSMLKKSNVEFDEQYLWK